MYYSVSTFGSQNSAIGVARSPSMEPNTWTDLGSTGVQSGPGRNYNAIDGNLISAGGNNYLTFGSFWGDIHQVQMGSTPTTAQSTPAQLIYDPADTAIEGPTMFQSGGFYYIFFSKGSCCGYDKNRPTPGREYRILVCRSNSPNGNFADRNGRSCRSGGGTVVLESHDWVYGPGGQGVYQDPQYGPVSALSLNHDMDPVLTKPPGPLLPLC